MYVAKTFKLFKKLPSSDFEVDISIVNELRPMFDNLDSVFERNSFYHVPIRIGYFGQIQELNCRLEYAAKQKMCYFGPVSELDYLLYLK